MLWTLQVLVITAFQTSACVAKCNGLFLKWGHETDFASIDDWLVTLNQKKKHMHCYMGIRCLCVVLLYLESLNIGLWTEILCQYAAGCQIQWMRVWYVVVVCIMSSEVWRIRLTCVISYSRLVKFFDARDVHITIWSSATWFTFLVFLMLSLLLCIF